MSKSTLNAEKRDISINPRELRRSGKIPATLYGKDVNSISLELDVKEFAMNYKKDRNAIFNLKIGKESFDSVVKTVQKKSMKDEILNVEFQAIKSDVKLKMTIPIKLTGTSPAVKMGGDLIQPVTQIEVECLPANIPSFLEIDISKLENYEDSITVGDIEYPENVKPTLNLDTVVVKVEEPATAEEIEAEEEAELAAPASAVSEETAEE